MFSQSNSKIAYRTSLLPNTCQLNQVTVCYVPFNIKRELIANERSSNRAACPSISRCHCTVWSQCSLWWRCNVTPVQTDWALNLSRHMVHIFNYYYLLLTKLNTTLQQNFSDVVFIGTRLALQADSFATPRYRKRFTAYLFMM